MFYQKDKHFYINQTQSSFFFLSQNYNFYTDSNHNIKEWCPRLSSLNVRSFDEWPVYFAIHGRCLHGVLTLNADALGKHLADDSLSNYHAEVPLLSGCRTLLLALLRMSRLHRARNDGELSADDVGPLIMRRKLRGFPRMYIGVATGDFGKLCVGTIDTWLATGAASWGSFLVFHQLQPPLPARLLLGRVPHSSPRDFPAQASLPDGPRHIPCRATTPRPQCWSISQGSAVGSTAQSFHPGRVLVGLHGPHEACCLFSAGLGKLRPTACQGLDTAPPNVVGV